MPSLTSQPWRACFPATDEFTWSTSALRHWSSSATAATSYSRNRSHRPSWLPSALSGSCPKAERATPTAPPHGSPPTGPIPTRHNEHSSFSTQPGLTYSPKGPTAPDGYSRWGGPLRQLPDRCYVAVRHTAVSLAHSPTHGT